MDGSGAAYVAGGTNSTDFPTTPGAFDTTYNGGTNFGDIFIAKLTADGSALEYGTYVGESGDEYGAAIAVDGSGAAHVTGEARGSLPTTPGAFDTSYNGGASDAFALKLDPDGADLAYATFLGGSGTDKGWSVALDPEGLAYISGDTGSSDLPTTPDAFDTSYNGMTDAFAAKLDAAGSALYYGTFVGGVNPEQGFGSAVDGSGAVYLTGYTYSNDLPTTPGAYDVGYNGWADAFVIKLAMGAPYSIAGRVTNIVGVGVPAVTIAATGGYSTTTDATGAYTLTVPLAGTYTFTPTLAGYSFEPPTRTVTVPPDATGQDFEREPFTDYLPLLLLNP